MAHDPTAQARPLVHRWLVGLLLGLVLIESLALYTLVIIFAKVTYTP